MKCTKHQQNGLRFGSRPASVALSYFQPTDEQSELAGIFLSRCKNRNDHGDKEIVLPYVNGEPADVVAGTLIFGSATKRVKVKTAVGWVDLNGQAGVVDTSLQEGLPPNPNAKIIIGSNTTDAQVCWYWNLIRKSS